MATVRLTERFAFSGGKVDRSGKYPVIREVLLCGPVSANGRRYKPGAFAGDRVKRYEGKPVYLDHTDGRTGRKFRDKLGWVENPRHRADGMPVGDLGINPKHAEAESVLWAAENKPDFASMSHVADCQTGREGGTEVVEEVVLPESVDVVVGAATTKSFYEQTGGTAVDRISLKQFSERFGPALGPVTWGGLRKLCEDMGAMADVPVMDDPAEGDAGDLKSGLIAALMPVIEEAFESGDDSAAVSALRDFIRLHAKHTGKGKADDTPAEEPADKKESVEVRMRESIAAFKKAGGKGIDPDELELLMSVPAAVRESLAKKLFGQSGGAGAEQPVSRARRPVVEEKKDAAGKVVEAKDHPKQVTWGG